MLARRLLLCCVVLLSSPLSASLAPGAVPQLGDYLPADVSYDPAVPTPRSVFGFEVGEWHLRPEQLVRYLELLASVSDRLELEVTGYTHERRPVLLLTFSSPRNLARLEEIRTAHLALGDPAAPEPSAEQLAAMPAVVWLGYSVHGDEASGSNAAPLVAYYLAAARGPEVDALLERTVILIDPQLNPDGGARFAQWANMHRGVVPVGDAHHREHVQVWPGGRTNHYWFDLNRDWLLLQQPESRARMRTFQRWRPNLLGDYHEMGSEGTFFFQPGVPERTHPLIPQRTVELTREIARYHADALDRAGRLYYSQETFDDFYPGKGSTYPDLNGAVGVLFEQASVRGHLRDTPNGPLSFPLAIHNQVLTSLSMLRAARERRDELLGYRREFYRQAQEEAGRDPVAAYVFAEPADPARLFHLLEVLTGHGLEVYRLAAPLSVDGRTFEPASAFVVPAAQPQYRLVKALFERRTDFADTAFYDISAWSLPLAFGVDNAELAAGRFAPRLLGERVLAPTWPAGRFAADAEPYAYLFEWSGYYAPRTLRRLLAAGFAARVATRPFTAAVADGERRFSAGTIVVPVGGSARGAELARLLRRAAEEDGVDVYSTATGLSRAGIDLGSPSLSLLRLPQPLLVVGDGVSANEAGEFWHLLDQGFQLGVSLVEGRRLGQLELAPYTHVILADGSYDELPEKTVTALRRWLRAGGTLITTQRAATWTRTVLLAAEPAATSAQPCPLQPCADPPRLRPPAPEQLHRYDDYERERDAELISGAIFEVELDLTHPLAFGFPRARLPVFRTSAEPLEASSSPYENLARYTAQPRLAGYASQANLKRLASTVAIRAGREGRGTVIQLADNPTFRGFWYGTQKLVLNALFFGPTLKATPPLEGGR